MNLFRDVANELLGMFVGEVGLSAAILAMVAGSAFLIKTEVLSSQLGGWVLFVGCLAILIGSVVKTSRRTSPDRH
jgi:Ca2+/H+ antiporter